MNSQNADQKPVRILHLEDNSLDIDLIKIQLQMMKLPFFITHVSSEPEFKASLEKNFVDIVISDSHVSGFDTQEALSFVREHYPKLPFVFFSGHLSPEIQNDALSHGASAFIDKNNPGQLISTIQRLCTHARLPAAGQSVVVQCRGFRCLACLDEKGRWVDVLNRRELPEVISWYDP